MPGDRFIELATTDGRRILNALFGHASEAVTVQDKSGRLIYANDNAARLVGLDSAEQMLTTPVADLVGQFEMINRSGHLMSMESLPGRRVMAGELFVEEVIGYRRKGSSRALWSRVHASPVKNDAGEVVFAINFFLDITAQVRIEETRALLGQVYEALGKSLQTDKNLNVLAHAIVPQIAGWCAVHLVEDGNLTRVAAAHPDTEDARTLVRMSDEETIPLTSDRLPARVAVSGRAEIIPSITDEMLTLAEQSEGSDFVGLIRRLQIHTVACFPLEFAGTITGTLTVARGKPDPAFDEGDLQLIEAIADRSATTLENARLYEQHREISETLQSALMPRFLPSLDGLHLAARYRPLSAGASHVGGDFYDVIPLSPNRSAIVVGDIAGKGIRAATAVGLARHTLRSVISLDSRPQVVFNQLNTVLLDEEPKRMCTLAYLLVERHENGVRVSVSLAGHPPPILHTTSGSATPLGHPCPPAGVLSNLDPTIEHYDMERGDMVVTYTDGFSISELAPHESVMSVLNGKHFTSPATALSHMLEVLESEGSSRRDDVALVAMQVAD